MIMKEKYLALIKELTQLIQKEVQEKKSAIEWLKKLEVLVKEDDWLSVGFHISKKPPLIGSYTNKVDLLEFEEKVRINFTEAKQRYNQQFFDHCKIAGIEPVTGGYSNGFTIKGFIWVFPDIDRGTSEIKTLARRKILKTIRISDVLKEVTRTDKHIFSRKFDPERFIEELYQAYLSIDHGRHDQVLLEEVMREIWKNRQPRKFWETFDDSKIQSYSIDEFSVDLTRLIESRQNVTKEGYKSQLSLGANGINIFDRSGQFKSYKFIKFIKGEGRW